MPKPSEADLLRKALSSLRLENKNLLSRLRSIESIGASEEAIQTKILKLKKAVDERVKPPTWLIEDHGSHSSPGVPTLVASDWHWGEVIDPAQIDGLNAYNMQIARKRAYRLVERTIDLLLHHMVNPKYPGIVLDLLGDFFSGDIHEELQITNEQDMMPVILDLIGVLIWCIRTLADHFGRVHVVCVTGNHGRTTKKIRFKGRAFTNFDWLTYHILRGIFDGSFTGQRDSRVSFLIPSGLDARYRIYTYRFLATHGDKLGHGGDGIIGALGPILRGDTKKRARNSGIGRDYDTMIIGHFHRYFPTPQVIVNGSLKGYDELADGENYGFDVPRQSLFLTHPEWGITCHWPVFVEPKPKIKPAPWVSV